MADRLQELLQQRALIKEHLAWIEGEIAAASGQPSETLLPASPSVPPAPLPPAASRFSPAQVLRASTPTGPRLRDDEDTLIAKLAAEEKTPPVPTKKGCWIFFSITLVALAGAAWAMLRFFYRD